VSTATEGRIEQFVTAVRASVATAHGPVAAKSVGATIVEIVEGIAASSGMSGPVAVSDGDALVASTEVVVELRDAGYDVITAADERWRAALPDAIVGITGAVAGVAAIGSVGVACGPGAPRATSVVPPAHICLVRAADVVDSLSDALAVVAAAGLPSNLVWVTGPSRTGDLEMTITMGVHGPKRVDVVIVD